MTSGSITKALTTGPSGWGGGGGGRIYISIYCTCVRIYAPLRSRSILHTVCRFFKSEIAHVFFNFSNSYGERAARKAVKSPDEITGLGKPRGEGSL